MFKPRSLILILPVLFAALLFVGCDATADREMKKAQEALDAAQEMGADAHAFEDFRKAEENFERAMEANEEGKIQDARNFAIKAKIQAEDAMSKTKDRMTSLDAERQNLGK